AEKEAAHLAAEEARAAREKSEAEIKYLNQERDHLTHEVSETRDKADLKLQELQDMMPTDDLAKERARRNEQMALDVKAKDLEEERLFLLSQHEPMEQEAQSLRKQFAKVYEEPAALAAEVQIAKLSDLKEQLAKFDEKSKALRERQETLAKRQEELAKENEEVRAKTEESKLREGYEVQEPCHRGVRLGSLLDFFQEHCGDITFEGGDMRKPLCLATKLTRRCHQDNQANRKRTKPLSPNTFAVEKLFIRLGLQNLHLHLNEEHGSSVSGVWNGEPVQASPRGWTEDFGDFCQGLCRLALSIIAREAPWIPQEEVFVHAKESKTTKTLVLSLPEDASSLMRAWCNVELFLAKVLNTRFGPLLEQPGREHQVQVLISFLVEVIPDIDFKKSQSWYEEDMLKLLSHMTDYVGPGTASGLNILEALKNTMADIVASQSLAVLAQSGKALQVKALDCRADPNARDGFGVAALTSVGNAQPGGSDSLVKEEEHHVHAPALAAARRVLLKTISSLCAHFWDDRARALLKIGGAEEHIDQHRSAQITMPHMLAVALCLGDTHPEVRKFASELLGKVKSFAAAPLAPAAAQPTGQDPAAKKKELEEERVRGLDNIESTDPVGDVPQVKEEAVMTSVQESQLGASKNTASIALGTSIFGHTQLDRKWACLNLRSEVETTSSTLKLEGRGGDTYKKKLCWLMIARPPGALLSQGAPGAMGLRRGALLTAAASPSAGGEGVLGLGWGQGAQRSLRWIGGAVKINAGTLVLLKVRLQLLQCFGDAEQEDDVDFELMLTATTEGLDNKRASLGARWTAVTDKVFSVAGLYGDYWSFILPSQDCASRIASHVLLGTVTVAFGFSVLLRPAFRKERPSLGENCPAAADAGDRCYACRVCAHTVHRRDHHCVWINQCVGSHNHRSFVAFVSGVTVLAWAYACMACSKAASEEGDQGTVADFLWQVLMIEQKLSPLMLGAVYAAGFSLFTLALFIGQVANISAGLTAYERKKLQSKGSGARQHSGKRRGCRANWLSWWSECQKGELQGKIGFFLA
ncbi:unnamed protein product, partial [Polarella glacialis]